MFIFKIVLHESSTFHFCSRHEGFSIDVTSVVKLAKTTCNIQLFLDLVLYLLGDNIYCYAELV